MFGTTKKREQKGGSQSVLSMNDLIYFATCCVLSCFQKPNINAETAVPINKASKNINGRLANVITNKPPCGAGIETAHSCVKPPAIAEPTMDEPITRIGSAAANGIAPSVMKDRPNRMLESPDFCSISVNLF